VVTTSHPHSTPDAARGVADAGARSPAPAWADAPSPAAVTKCRYASVLEQHTPAARLGRASQVAVTRDRIGLSLVRSRSLETPCRPAVSTPRCSTVALIHLRRSPSGGDRLGPVGRRRNRSIRRSRESLRWHRSNVSSGMAICALLASGLATGRTRRGAGICDRVLRPGTARPGGNDAVLERFIGSLRPGQTGCLRSGTYAGDVRVSRGNIASPLSRRARAHPRPPVALALFSRRRTGRTAAGWTQQRTSALADGEWLTDHIHRRGRDNSPHRHLLQHRLSDLGARGRHGDRTQPHPRLRASACRSAGRSLLAGAWRYRSAGPTPARRIPSLTSLRFLIKLPQSSA
jgi:hypothetical protein